MKKFYDTKEEAIASFAQQAIALTDRYNKEHAAVLREKNGKYYYTKIERGFHATVWPTALKYALARGEKYFMHTHPNSGRLDSKGMPRDNNPFSGIPGSRKLKDAGDAMVVDVLKYNGIYLVSAMGNAYLYEGKGPIGKDKNTHANNKNEFRNLKPVQSGLARSEYCYRKIGSKKRKFEKASWTINNERKE